MVMDFEVCDAADVGDGLSVVVWMKMRMDIEDDIDLSVM